MISTSGSMKNVYRIAGSRSLSIFDRTNNHTDLLFEMLEPENHPDRKKNVAMPNVCPTALKAESGSDKGGKHRERNYQDPWPPYATAVWWMMTHAVRKLRTLSKSARRGLLTLMDGVAEWLSVVGGRSRLPGDMYFLAVDRPILFETFFCACTFSKLWDVENVDFVHLPPGST
jgi:hypothetical protein